MVLGRVSGWFVLELRGLGGVWVGSGVLGGLDMSWFSLLLNKSLSLDMDVLKIKRDDSLLSRHEGLNHSTLRQRITIMFH